MKTLFTILILALYLFNTTYAGCVVTAGFIVQIDNGIPNSSINLHCKSKDDDLGSLSLAFKQYFAWKFCVNIRHTTLYNCEFFWDSRAKSFIVFDKHVADECPYKDQEKRWMCHWVVRPDGFYIFSKNSSSWVKKYDW